MGKKKTGNTQKSQQPQKTPASNPSQTSQTSPDKKEQERTTRAKARFLKAFVKSKAMMCAAAKSANISRRQVATWKEQDPQFLKDYVEVEELACEFVESCMMKGIKKGNTTFTIFYLVNRSKGRWENTQKIEQRPDDSTSTKIDKLLSNTAKLLEMDK